MGGSGGACKFLGIFFILSLLLQGVCAAEESNEANANSNYTINDTVNGTIIGTINGTINNTINDTVNGTVVGTISGTINGTISGTISKTDPIQWVLILPILVGYLIFLCWMCRFFDGMNFCFVFFILIMLIVLLRFIPSNLIPASVLNISVIGLFVILLLAISYESISRWQKNPGNEINTIMILHDIIRNFIVIFATLMWPLLLLYLSYKNIKYVAFYGMEDLKFSTYIIAASTIGSLSYLLLSIEEIFSQLIPEYKKMSIVWSYVRRILIAPFIALLAVYILPFQDPNNANTTNEIFIFVFSFFAGYYTKTVEEWAYRGVQGLLPQDKKVEFNSRNVEYDVEKSDFNTELGLDKDLVYMLYNAKIRSIEELANCNVKELLNKVNLDTRNLGEGIGCSVKKQRERLGSYSEQQIQLAIDKAQESLGIDKSKLVTVLKMDKELASKLYNFANIKTIEDLSTRNSTYICKRLQTCHEEVKENDIKEFIEKALHYMAIKNSNLIGLGMPVELVFKISYKTNIDSIKKLKDKSTEEIHKNLADEFKEDVTKDKINEYKELAQKKYPDL